MKFKNKKFKFGYCHMNNKIINNHFGNLINNFIFY